MAEQTLADITAELYAGSPDDFVAARNARANEVDDPDLAKQIRALRKPSLAAWVVNMFARERAQALSQALTLAEELREAQTDLDAAALTQLSRQRRALTDRLSADAAELATARGGRVTSSTREAVEQTIRAAFFDRDAATAVASGRLVRQLDPSGSTDLGTVVGGGPPESVRAPSPPPDELRARRDRHRAERAVHDAEKALSRAQRAQTDAERGLREAVTRYDELDAKKKALDAELRRVRSEADELRTRLGGLEQRRAAAADDVDEAKRALSAAQTALEDDTAP